MQHIYGLFGFDFELELSTRPENFLGDIETWNQAESVRMTATTANPNRVADSISTATEERT